MLLGAREVFCTVGQADGGTRQRHQVRHTITKKLLSVCHGPACPAVLVRDLDLFHGFNHQEPGISLGLSVDVFDYSSRDRY
ncbi:hypothetical protein Pan241w_09790 [Gimesia alba]|uniref:Uncharacterized protein n=1 Tax=Gimesia alba TaxID=2527973 RepID=A0A517RAM1_9PLAN|nr:hypothetical protein Pan241w_09790 [Gimesia alba]